MVEALFVSRHVQLMSDSDSVSERHRLRYSDLKLGLQLLAAAYKEISALG